MAHYYQGPQSTMLMPQPLPMPSQQPGQEVHSSYKDIMPLNYGRNPFVQKNDINNENVYRFKFRGKDVCITLYQVLYMKDILYMHVDGDGRTEWCDAATPILNKQFERLQSGKLKIPGADTGENKKPLVSEEEFYNCFAIPNVYGNRDLPWPRSTILLYKYSSNATTKYWEIPEDTWKRIDNILYGQHAEQIMIEDLENILEYLTIQPDDNEGSYKAILSVEVILSYSPCGECSQGLCLLKEKMDKKLKQSKKRNKDPGTVLKKLSTLSLSPEIEEAEKVKFKITFSNFYKHLENIFDTGKQNIEGLKDLLRSDIKLDVFSDDNWDYFFNAAGLVTERQKRERDDKKILQYLEGVAIEQDLRKNRLL